MVTNLIIVDASLGVRDAELYEIEDKEETFQEWQNLHADFMNAFGRFSSPDGADYELPEWHHGLLHL